MSDYSDAADKVAKLRDELADQHDKATESSMEDMERAVQAQIRRNDSVARRVLVNDTDTDAKPSPLLVAYSVNVPLWAQYLEHGTGQRARRDTQPDHRQFDAPDPLPPLDPILAWVVKKNLTSDTYDTKTALAEAIARTIGEEGTFPHPFLRPVWFSGRRGYRRVIRANKRGMARALRRAF